MILEDEGEVKTDKLEENRSEWIVVTDPQYNELLREIESLKHIVIELHSVVNSQSDSLHTLTDNSISIKDKMNKINNEISCMKESQVKQTYLGYIKDYAIPMVSLVGLNYPIFYLAGPKGAIISTMSYMFWKMI